MILSPLKILNQICKSSTPVNNSRLNLLLTKSIKSENLLALPPHLRALKEKEATCFLLRDAHAHRLKPMVNAKLAQPDLLPNVADVSLQTDACLMRFQLELWVATDAEDVDLELHQTLLEQDALPVEEPAALELEKSTTGIRLAVLHATHMPEHREVTPSACQTFAAPMRS
jgi:hypothetical protein